uniref:hypothetical protein n=1 Tax=Mariniflexile sp. TaxID=1979402 RepID=UPI0040478F5D
LLVKSGKYANPEGRNIMPIPVLVKLTAKNGQNRGFLHPAIFPRAKPAGICEPRPEYQRCRQEKAYQQRAAQGEHLRFHEQKEEGQTASEKIFPSRARPVSRIRVL